MANHPRVVGDGDLEWSEHSHGEKFAVVGLPPASLYKRRKVASWSPAYLCVSGRRFFRGWRIH